MRNLYSKLNVHSAAPSVEIGAAIARCSSASVRADAKAVLLYKARREKYDRLNVLLTDIGNLRSSLGLSYTENWQGEEATEYGPSSEAKRSRYEEFTQKLEKLNQRPRIVSFGSVVKHLLFKLIGGVIVIAVIFIVLYISSPPSTPQLSTPSTRDKLLPSLLSVSSSEDTKQRLIRKLDKLEKPINTPKSKAESTLLPRSELDSLEEPINTPKSEVEDTLFPGRMLDSLVKDPINTFLPPALDPPDSGTTRKHAAAASVVPFRIKISAGSNYFIKLESSLSGRAIMDLFVRGGDTVEVLVPLGKYIIKYAVGDIWYGYQHYFGPRTSYYKADSVFHFTKDGNRDIIHTEGDYWKYFAEDSNRIRGYTFTLYRAPHGNSGSSQIDAPQF